jgi:hypothetical protein
MTSVSPRAFIMAVPEDWQSQRSEAGPSLDRDSIHRFILGHQFPVPFGPELTAALRSQLEAGGFTVKVCRLHDAHPIAIIRMDCGAAGPPPLAQIRRLFRRVAAELGYQVAHNGLNLMLRHNRVEIEAALDVPPA